MIINCPFFQFNITCDENQWKLSLVGTFHFLGIMTGSAFFGFLADKYGRKNIFIISIFAMSCTGIAQALCNSYIPFLILNFLNAVGTSGVYPMAFILGESGSYKKDNSFKIFKSIFRS